jgi:hypothetical protein
LSTKISDLRKTVPLSIKLEAALLQLGLDPKACHLDHDPALALRPLNEAGTDFDPPQHDPRYMRWVSTSDHSRKTTGRKGESKLSISGGDQQKIAKVKRLEKKFVSRLLRPEKKERPKRKWPSRPFAKRK